MSISIDDTAARCGYMDPPAELSPAGHIHRDHAAWSALWDWFEDETQSANDSMLVYAARRYGWTIEQAYIATDGLAKGKLGMCGFN